MEEGNALCKSEHVLFKSLPSNMPYLKYRNKDMVKLVRSLVMNKERIITLLGLHGMGKTSLVKNTLHYIYVRRFVLGGIMWIKMKGVTDVYTVIKQMQHTICRVLNQSDDDVLKTNLQMLTSEDLLEFIINFINDPGNETYQSKYKKRKYT